MANPDGYPREAYLKLTHGAGYVEYRGTGSTNRMLSWELQVNENHPKKLTLLLSNGMTTTTENLLSSSCAVWSSGTGALARGDAVRFGLYQSDGSTVDVRFDGYITDIKALPAGKLQIVCVDPSARLDYEHRTLTHGANYRDQVIKAVSTSQGLLYMSGVSEADVVEPFAFVGYAHTETRVALGDGNNSTDHAMTDQDDWVAQPFIAEGDGMLGFKVRITTDVYRDKDTLGAIDSLKCYIRMDDDNSPGRTIWQPVGGKIYGLDICHVDDTFEVETISSNEPLRLVKGQRYWLEFGMWYDNLDPNAEVTVEAEDADTTESPVNAYKYAVGGAAAAWESGQVLDVTLDFCDYEEIPRDQYKFYPVIDWLDFNTEKGLTALSSPSYTYYRGKLSFYYGTITKEQLCQRLIEANTGLLKDLSTSLDRTFGVYSTRGKSLGDCLREIMDVYENSGSWDGYQSVMAHYMDGSSIHRLKVGKRKKTSDSATYILSSPLDRSNTDEHLVMAGGMNLRQTNKMKYARVLVTGKSPNGDPIVVTRSDQAKSTSFWDQMHGLAETMVVNDENIQTLEEADKMAYRLLDAVNRDDWEGQLQLSGQHDDMFEWTTNDVSYGSGEIITLYWSKLGISNEKFKVKQMILRPYTTTIYVSNEDPLLRNKMTEGWGRAERTEGFLAPVGTPEVIYGSSYTGTTITTATLYMELCDSSGTALDGSQRVLCTKLSSTDYNLNVYHAEFPAGNGHSSTIGGVGQIKLYDDKLTGSLIATVDLTRTVSSIVIDEEVDKFQGTRLIFEVLADAS